MDYIKEYYESYDEDGRLLSRIGYGTLLLLAFSS